MGADRRTNASVGTTLLLWASAFVAIRVALPGFSVGGLSLRRLLVASAALAVAAPLLHVRRPARVDLVRIVGCGLTGMTAYQLLLNAGERTVPAGTASLLVSTGPIFAGLLAVALLREPLSARGWTGIALGFAGAAIMSVAQGGGLRPSAGALLTVGAAFAQALFFVLQKPLLTRYRGFEVTCYAMWSGTLLALPLTAALATDLPRAGCAPLAAVVFLGVAPSALGFVTWAYGQARLPVATAANALYVVPFMAIGIGWIALHETVHAGALAGGLVALTGVAVSRGVPNRTSAAALSHTRGCQDDRPPARSPRRERGPDGSRRR